MSLFFFSLQCERGFCSQTNNSSLRCNNGCTAGSMRMILPLSLLIRLIWGSLLKTWVNNTSICGWALGGIAKGLQPSNCTKSHLYLTHRWARSSFSFKKDEVNVVQSIHITLLAYMLLTFSQGLQALIQSYFPLVKNPDCRKGHYLTVGQSASNIKEKNISLIIIH